MLLRTFFVLAVCWTFAAEALAVSVTINWVERPICTYSNGRLAASATGGVGPYTYLWSNGAITAMVVDLPAGSYSVTVTDFNGEEATANHTLISVGYDLNELLIFGNQGRCGEVDHLVLDVSDIEGPPPYYVDGELLVDPYHPYIPATNDTTYIFTFEDGNGCTGTIEDVVGWPYEFPDVNVLDIMGSCANDSSGQVTLDVGSETHAQEFIGSFWGNGTSWCGSQYQNAITPCYELPPGDYYLALTGPAAGPDFAWNGCADTTWFAVPNLGPTCGSIRGRTHLDYTRDCENSWSEPGVGEQLLEILPGPYYTLSRQYSGMYGLQLPFGDYTMQQLGSVYEPYCQPDPVPFTLTPEVPWTYVNIADTSTLVQSVEVDMQVMLACGAARPGFELEYAIHRSNLGPGATGNQVLTLSFDPILGYLNATPAPTSVDGNTLTWNAPSMWGSSLAVTYIQFQVPPDIELLGTVLEASVSVSIVQTDVDLSNNSASHSCVITGAYDPNDKRARTSTGISDSLYYIMADDYIDYTIRFQNTGTDTAFHVVVTDTIAPNLDLRTFVAGASSQSYDLSIRNGNTLRFAFYNIQLPDSNVNEPASHGFVSFRIKPREPVLPGTTFENIANIYFDFNPPVITEPSVLVAEFSTGVNTHAAGSILIRPNPAREGFHVDLPGMRTAQIILRDLHGRTVKTISRPNDRLWIDTQNLSSGSYIVEAISTSGARCRSVVHVIKP